MRPWGGYGRSSLMSGWPPLPSPLLRLPFMSAFLLLPSLLPLPQGIAWEVVTPPTPHSRLMNGLLSLSLLPLPQGITWEAVVIDEAHRMKTVSSSTRQVIVDMRIEWLLLLTGTPVQVWMGLLGGGAGGRGGVGGGLAQSAESASHGGAGAGLAGLESRACCWWPAPAAAVVGVLAAAPPPPAAATRLAPPLPPHVTSPTVLVKLSSPPTPFPHFTPHATPPDPTTHTRPTPPTPTPHPTPAEQPEGAVRAAEPTGPSQVWGRGRFPGQVWRRAGGDDAGSGPGAAGGHEAHPAAAHEG